jgi:hypothetical protein
MVENQPSKALLGSRKSSEGNGNGTGPDTSARGMWRRSDFDVSVCNLEFEVCVCATAKFWRD